jgi:galactose-1-phosphate uridylyltransferase
VWQEQYRELSARKEINHVLIFENKGEAVGVSNPHPHCQIYATNFVFKTIETEARASQQHFAETGPHTFSGCDSRREGRWPPHHLRERIGNRFHSLLRAIRV